MITYLMRKVKFIFFVRAHGPEPTDALLQKTGEVRMQIA